MRVGEGCRSVPKSRIPTWCKVRQGCLADFTSLSHVNDALQILYHCLTCSCWSPFGLDVVDLVLETAFSIQPCSASTSKTMYQTLPRLATISLGRSLRGKGPTLSLEHVRTSICLRSCNDSLCSQFVQRQKVLALWRDCVRTIYSKACSSQHHAIFADASIEIPRTSDTREEMRSFARDEFERYKHVNDIVSS